ncbi:MAG: hypothetical protein JWP89_840 [Schlesneria sp.]|nr:hypothetical protein [Schlesneria sp.]
MARRAFPWYRKSRKAWFVVSSGKQINLGSNKARRSGCFMSCKRDQNRLVLSTRRSCGSQAHTTPASNVSLILRIYSAEVEHARRTNFKSLR